MRMALGLAAGLVVGAASHAEPPASLDLRFDPFSRAGWDEGEAPEREPTAGAWAPVLSATLVDAERSFANLGGIVLLVGEEAHGYRLLEVREWEAIFQQGDREVVLPVSRTPQ